MASIARRGVRVLLSIARRRASARLVIVAMLVAVGMVTSQRAQQVNLTSAAPNFDVRIAKDGNAADYMTRNVTGAVVSGYAAARSGAEARLQVRAGGVDVIDAPEMSIPEIVSAKAGRGYLTAATNDRAGAMRQFLFENSSLYGLSLDQVASLELIANYENPAGNMAWVEYEQRINGIRVFGGLIRGGFTSRGELARTTGQLAAGLDPAALPIVARLSGAEAVSAAATSVGWRVSSGALVQKSFDGTRTTYARGPLADDSKVWQVYFPLAPGVARLAWAAEIWGDPDAFLVVIDAEDGTVLFRKNLTDYQTQTATYRIYADDSPAPMSPSTVLPGSGTQAPFIPRVSVELIGNEGVNSFNNLGWMTDNTSITDGNNVEAGVDLVAPDGIEGTINGVSRVFDFAFDPTTDPPSNGPYRAGEVTDTFYWTNWYHDRLYLLGFTEAAGNFQNDNFGRGGPLALAGDRISAEIQDFSGTNNANFSTPSDGSRGRMQMYIFPGPDPDRTSGLDHDVLLHELTHGTSNRLHQKSGGGLFSTMSGGMGEGWSDFYARALLSTASENPNGIYNTGGWVTYQLANGYVDNYYYGIRRFPYAVKSNVGANGKPHNPLTFADIDNSQASLTDGAFPKNPVAGSSNAFEVHNIGEVWAMTLLEARARFINRLGFDTGNQRFLQFVTDGMKLDPSSPNLLQGRDSIIAAANAGGGTAGDIADIWAGFAARGMGYSAQVVNASVGLVVEAFDLPGVAPLSSAITTEAFPNGRLDPGEAVTVSLCVTNNAAAISGTVTGTLLATGGVTPPLPPVAQGYGTIATGAAVCRSFDFTVGAACGSRVTATLHIDETGAAGRDLVYSIGVGGLSAPSYSENFDGVTAPALPAGWTTSTLSGTASLWVTSTSGPDTAPNRAFVVGPSTPSDNVLVSPPILVSGGVSQLTFRNNYNMEATGDGGVLELSIGGGPFLDIVAAGGAFTSGGYSGKLLSNTPTTNRFAWTGTSSGYVTTAATLPASTVGQMVVFRWRSVTDTGTSSVGWGVDTVTLATFNCANESAGIVVQPQSQTITVGDNAMLAVFATGTSPVTYQWYQGSSPSTASPIAGATSSLFVTPQLTIGTNYWVRVTGAVGPPANSNTAAITITNSITAHAAYDGALKTPRCFTPGAECDSDAVLLNGRANITGGPEANQPNTINNSCPDGPNGVYHVDASIDRIKVGTLDGTPMATGKTVRVVVNVWVFSANDRLDLYFAANAASPIWTPLGTLTPLGTGAQTLSTNYILPTGPMQAVRANFRSGGSQSSCSIGFFDDHDDLVFGVGPTAGTELITNGDFSNGTTGWLQWEPPNIVSSVVNGVFQFFQNTPPVGSGQATVFQLTGRPVIAGAPLLASFQLGNTGSVRKRMSVLVLDSDFSDIAVCTFWLQPNQVLKTYTMRTHATRNWANASIYFYSATPGGTIGNYLVDNVSLKYTLGQATDRADCLDANAPTTTAGVASGNLLVNGDFASGALLPGWSAMAPITAQVTAGVLEFLRPTPAIPAGVVIQATGTAAVQDQLFTATFQLGNSSTVRKRVTVLLHDADLSVNPDLTACTFVLPPNFPLSNYTMKGRATRAWTNSAISFYPATVGLEPWIRLDNVTFSKTAPTATIGTECIEPALTFPPPIVDGGSSASRGGSAGSSVGVSPPTARAGTPTPARVDHPRLAGDDSFTITGGGGWRVEATSTRREVLRWTDAIDLTGASSASLTMTSRFTTRASSAEIQVSLDGITWERVAFVPPTIWFTPIDIDLSDYAGQTIYIQFVFDAVAPDAGVPPDVWHFYDAVITLRGGRGGG